MTNCIAVTVSVCAGGTLALDLVVLISVVDVVDAVLSGGVAVTEELEEADATPPAATAGGETGCLRRWYSSKVTSTPSMIFG